MMEEVQRASEGEREKVEGWRREEEEKEKKDRFKYSQRR
jgi:hypothetical protein